MREENGVLSRRPVRVLVALSGVVLVTYVGYRLIPVNATSIGFAYLPSRRVKLLIEQTVRLREYSPEKAGVGGSTPSLATLVINYLENRKFTPATLLSANAS